MAEICSSLPTTGGVYYWRVGRAADDRWGSRAVLLDSVPRMPACRPAPTALPRCLLLPCRAGVLGGKHGPLWSWIVGWLNLIGQVGGARRCHRHPLASVCSSCHACRAASGSPSSRRCLPQVGITAGVEWTVVRYLVDTIKCAPQLGWFIVKPGLLQRCMDSSFAADQPAAARRLTLFAACSRAPTRSPFRSTSTSSGRCTRVGRGLQGWRGACPSAALPAAPAAAALPSACMMRDERRPLYLAPFSMPPWLHASLLPCFLPVQPSSSSTAC